MTTAHRPTWKAAVGQANEGGWTAGGAISQQTSVRDAPAHLKLKYRLPRNKYIDNEDDDNNNNMIIKQSLLELQQAEQEARLNVAKTKRPIDRQLEERSLMRLLKQTAEVDVEKLKQKYNDSDIENDDDDDDDDGGGNRSDDGGASSSDLDEDDDSEEDASSSEDDQDDEAALQAELAKIRAERAQAKERQEAEAAAKIQKEQEALDVQAAVTGNPLLMASNPNSTNRLKRRWNDDVVFRNQAKNEPVAPKRFINDTVRNDFHKRFLNKFIR
jgi:protein CWC15